VIKAEAHPAVS